MTAEDQLEVIWWALGSSRFWMSVNADGSMVLQENDPNPASTNRLGRTLHQFRGTRLEIAEQLVALRVGDRLEGISHDLMPSASARDTMKKTFIG